jgi:murein DD-endopeptidase MepM/ murein hydrolase activator NlpD
MDPAEAQREAIYRKYLEMMGTPETATAAPEPSRMPASLGRGMVFTGIAAGLAAIVSLTALPQTTQAHLPLYARNLETLLSHETLLPPELQSNFPTPHRVAEADAPAPQPKPAQSAAQPVTAPTPTAAPVAALKAPTAPVALARPSAEAAVLADTGDNDETPVHGLAIAAMGPELGSGSGLFEPAAFHAAKPAPPAGPVDQVLTVNAGDTLANLLARAGADRHDSNAAIGALDGHYDPRHIRPGDEISVTLVEDPDSDAPARLLALTLAPDIERDIRVIREDDGNYEAETIKHPLSTQIRGAELTIENSLFVDGGAAGVPMPILIELIRAYSYDVDFQRDIQPGDRLKVMYESQYKEDGTFARHGRVLMASLHTGGKDLGIYLYKPTSGSYAGRASFFDANGQSIVKALLRTPVDGARVSSGFGMRKHPILGYSRMHTGIDFAAPTGTPIFASGDGVIEMAGRNGGYGNYVRIRHDGSYKTAYGHMNRFGKGIAAGKRVSQGQIIGYVGSTGRSTGPHLHYEVLKNGKPMNPSKVSMPAGPKLAEAELERFQSAREALVAQFAALPTGPQVAQTTMPLPTPHGPPTR